MLTQFQSTFFQQEKRKVNRIGWVILFLSKAWIYIWTWISHNLSLSLTPNFTLNTYPKLTLISNFNVKCTLNPVLTLVIQSWILLKLVLLTLWSVPIDQAFTPIKKFEFFSQNHRSYIVFVCVFEYLLPLILVFFYYSSIVKVKSLLNYYNFFKFDITYIFSRQNKPIIPQKKLFYLLR